jgi:hypothetical protein
MTKDLVLSLQDNFDFGDDNEDILKRKLEKNGLFIPTNLYRAVPNSPEVRENLRLHGTDHPEFPRTLMALNHKQVFIDREYGGGDVSLFTYTDVNSSGEGIENSLILVYDGTYLKDSGFPLYTFKDPTNKKDALLAKLWVKQAVIRRERL